MPDALKPGPQSVALDRLREWPENPRKISDAALERLKQRLVDEAEMLEARPLIALPDGTVIAGNMRLRAAAALGWKQIAVHVIDADEKRAREIALTDNNQFGQWEEPELAAIIADLQQQGTDPLALGFEADDVDRLLAQLSEPVGGRPPDGPSLADRFLVPPFTTLDARQGYWRARDAQWLAIGIKSEEGRGENLLGFSDTVLTGDFYAQKRAREAEEGREIPIEEFREQHLAGKDGKRAKAYNTPSRRGESHTKRFFKPAHSTEGFDTYYYRHMKAKAEAELGRELTDDEFRADHYTPPPAGRSYSPSGWDADYYRKKKLAEQEAGRDLTTEEFEAEWWQPTEGRGDIVNTGTSVFSPTLCEIVYRWWSPKGGTILDPFAGGSVRGIVASRLGRQYRGIDLSEVQVGANREQAKEILRDGDFEPGWTVGDAAEVLTDGHHDGPFDLIFSCPPYFDLEVYSEDERDLSAMEPEAFVEGYRGIVASACERLAEDRFACFVVGDHRQGHRQLSLVAETIHAFEDAGAFHYNHAVLITPTGSAAIRAARSFAVRKLTRTHQHVLVFCKGDPVRASEACGPVEVDAEAFGEAA